MIAETSAIVENEINKTNRKDGNDMAEKTEEKQTKKGLLTWVRAIIVASLIAGILYLLLGGGKKDGTSSPESRVSSTDSQTTQSTVVKPWEERVRIGTKPYDPNTKGIIAHIWGEPLENDVYWGARGLYTDGTIEVQHMKPRNCGEIHYPEFRSTEANPLRRIEYFVEKDQKVKDCLFMFKFSRPR